MDVGQVRCFLAVAEDLHFGRAAARLHMAQPPLSRTIKQLERELGTSLFDRNTRRVRLTASGRALLAPAAAVLDALRRAEAAVKAADGESGVVRIAFAGVSTHRLVARLARAVRSEHPGIQLELTSQQFAQPALTKLQRGDTDLVLGRFDVVPADLDAEVVMTDSLVLALPDTHCLAGNAAVSVADLAQDQFVSLSELEGSVLPDRLRRLAGDSGFFPEIVQTAPDTQTALALVGAEVGCHLTLASVAENDTVPHVRFVPVTDDAPDVHLRMAWRRSGTEPALHAVRHALAELG